MNYCPKCGFQLNNTKFCPMCGFNVSGEERPQQQEKTSIDYSKTKGNDDVRSLREALVGKKADHYVPIFEELDNSGGSSWNWCGFLVSPMWFAYRKMYSWAAIAIAAPLAAGLLLGFVLGFVPGMSDGAYDVVTRLVSLVFAVWFGAVSNKEYKKRIDKLILEMPKDAISREQYINNNGGVSVPGVILILFIRLLIVGMSVALVSA